MSKTDNLGLEIPSASDKHIFSTYKDNNEIIDEAYGQYLEDQETSQENIAMIESHTAQSNHAIGSYFMLDNVLHKATSAIASGETITSGSNATPITLEQAITALNTSVQALRDSVEMFEIGQSAYGTVFMRGRIDANNMIQITCESNGLMHFNAFVNGVQYDKSWS